MFIFRFTPILWILPVLLVAGWWLVRRSHVRRVILGLRSATVILLVLALANPVRPGTAGARALVFVVDQSDSLPQATRTQLWNQTQAIAEQLRTVRPVQVVVFGGDAAVALTDDPPTINSDGTDIAGALRLAAGLAPNNGTVVLLSDGGVTTPDTLAQSQQLAARGISVDVVPLTSTFDLRIESLRIPPAVRENERFSADLVIVSQQDGTANLTLTRDGEPIAQQQITLAAGRTSVSFQTQIAAQGFHRFAATMTASDDPQPANNTLAGWTVVGPPPRVLVVERDPDSAASLRDALERAGLVTEAVRPPNLSNKLSALGTYDAIVLQDVPASALTYDQQAALREYVRSLGHGLIALGGSNSYLLGGYKGTPLEEVLPVEMEPPPRRERPEVALLLIVDRSASMLGLHTEDKLGLAKAAAIGATESLGPNDSIGVLSFETTQRWEVPFTTIGTGLALSDIQQRITAIEAGGGTNIYGALRDGLTALAQQPTRVRHAVLLTDGRSNTDQSYEALIAPLRAQGITLSTIAIGKDADQPLLESLAKLGAGRYHYAATPEELPRLTLQETEIARQNPITEGDFRANLITPHPAIRGLDIAALPHLMGYVATTPKPEAEILLESPEGDVLLATWQYGLGRAIAWTSDTGERWTTDWLGWPGYGSYWAQIIAATYPDPAASLLRLDAVVAGSAAQVTLDAVSAEGEPIDLADVGLRVLAPDGTEQVVRAIQQAPGRYAAAIDTPQPGAYQLLAALEQPGTRLEARSGVVRGYAAELGATPDPALLTQIAALTQGRVLPDLSAVVADSAALAPPRPTIPLWPPLVALALALWILEISVRRRNYEL